MKSRRLRRVSRVRLTNSDRLFFIQLYRWFPSVLRAITIIRPESRARGGIVSDVDVAACRFFSMIPRAHLLASGDDSALIEKVS